MTLLNEETADHTSGGRTELPLKDRVPCPECNADPVDQVTVSWVPDGALEIVIFVCRSCGSDHAIWF